jgi:uncharacterized membrane protein
MSRLPLLWALTSVVAAIVVLSLVLADVQAAVRAPAVLAFVFLFPGLAVVRLLAITGDRLTELTLGAALSVAIAVLIPTALLYLGGWSPNGALAVLVAITLGCTALEVSLSAYAARRSEPTTE